VHFTVDRFLQFGAEYIEELLKHSHRVVQTSIRLISHSVKPLNENHIVKIFETLIIWNALC